MHESRDVNGFPMRPEPAVMLANYVDSIIRECLYAHDLDRAEGWLRIDISLLTAPVRAEHFLSGRLLRGDLADHAQEVRAAIEAVESLRTRTMYRLPGDFDEQVRAAIQTF